MDQQEAKIGNTRVLLYLNQKAVEGVRAEGVEWPEAICFFMARNFGSRNELEVSSDCVTLAMISKIRCQTTPIYRDRTGGIYVLFEELDNETREKECLEFLGTIDPRKYAGALCAQFGINGKNVYV